MTDEQFNLLLMAELVRGRRALEALCVHLGVPRGGAAQARHGGEVGRVAGDAELDGKYGDPKIVCDPRDWNGQSFKGARMSEAPPDFLDLLAVVLDGFADGELDAKKKRYKRDDAAKARGWARRKRAPANGSEEDFG